MSIHNDMQMRTFEQHIASNVRVSSYSKRHAPLFIIKAARGEHTRFSYHISLSLHCFNPTIFYLRENILYCIFTPQTIFPFCSLFTTRQQLSNYSLLKIYTCQKSFASICFRLFKSWYIVFSGVDKPTEFILLFSCWCAFSESTSFLIYSRAMRGTSFRSAALRSQSFIMQIRGLPR